MARSSVVLGVHGAGWANLLFAWDGAHAIEMGLPEPHARLFLPGDAAGGLVLAGVGSLEDLFGGSGSPRQGGGVGERFLRVPSSFGIRSRLCVN